MRKNNYGVSNFGISFGLNVVDSFVLLKILLTGIVMVFGISILVLRKRISRYLLMIFIGGLGNLLWRIIWGSVWDYIKVPFFDIWLNFSDILISFGAISYILVGDEIEDNLRDS